MTLTQLAQTYASGKQFEKAESAYRRLLAFQEKQHGVTGPMLLGTLRGLEQVLVSLGKNEEAQQVRDREAALQAAVLKPVAAK